MNDAAPQADTPNTEVKTTTPPADGIRPPKVVKVGGRQGGKTAAAKKKAKAPKAAAKPAPARKSAAKPKKDRAPKLASKADTVIALLRRGSGATMQEMQEATSWKPHSVRAFISAGLKKKGLQVVRTKGEGGISSTYHLPEPAEAI